MRSFWSGMISFGLVNIPVRLYVAVENREFELNYLRKEDHCPIQYKKVCRWTGEEVEPKDIVKGYEYQKGEFVILEDEDFKKADMAKTYTIDIEVFVNEKDVDLKYVEKPYYLEPEKKAHKTYALFHDAMVKSKRVGIGKFVLKNREHLVMLKPEGGIIMLLVMRFHSLIRDPGQLDIPKAVKTPQNQMDLALELIHKLEGPFKPQDFEDTYTERLREVIEAKKKGKAIHVEEHVPRETEASDILNRLKESLAAAGK